MKVTVIPDTDAIRAGITERVIPPQALPANPEGIHWWESKAMVGAIIAAVVSFLGAVAALLSALGLGEWAEWFGFVRALDQAQLVNAIVAVTSIAGTVAGIVAAIGRKNKGRAASPIK